jgi:integrase
MMGLREAMSLAKGERGEGARAYVESKFPDTVRALRMVDFEYSRPRVRKGFSLVRRESRKRGFVYYARYYHGGRMLPSKWNTHTGVLEEAERFAKANRERLVSRYLKGRDTRMYGLLEKYYGPGSEMLACEGKRNRRLNERCRKEYHAIIVKKLIPFLREERIGCFEGITVGTLSDFQDRLLAAGLKPQTVNNNLKVVKRALAYVARKGIIAANPGKELMNIPVSAGDRRARGCYELGRVSGVFRRQWRDAESYLLCLLIYTTGMRNGEINRVRMGDIVTIEGARFIDIRESKTAAGVRLVPLHDFVWRKLKARAGGKGPEEPVFGYRRAGPFIAANLELGRRLGAGAEELERERITFYSGRHYWKTLMSSEGLGEDVEEMFMGHKVSGNVAKLYNHKDRLGKERMAGKARRVFGILDRCLFGSVEG